MHYKPRCTAPKASRQARKQIRRSVLGAASLEDIPARCERDKSRAARLARWEETRDLSVDACPLCKGSAHFTTVELDLALDHGALLHCHHCDAQLVLAVTHGVAHLVAASATDKISAERDAVVAEKRLRERAAAGDEAALRQIYGGK